MRATEFINKQQGAAEGLLNEFATDSGGGGDDILKTLAAQWLNGDVSSGDLDSDIQSQEKVERRLEKGVTCPDGVKRKLYIDYSDDYEGVVIYGDDNWSITYKQDDLSESHQGVAEVVSSQYQTILYEYTTTQVIDKENIKVWKIERDPKFPPSEVIIKREMSKIRVHASVDNEYIKGKNAEHANDSVLLLRTWLKVVLEELPKFVKDDDTSIRIEAHGKRANIYERVMPKILTALQQVNPGWVYNESWVNNTGATFFTFTNYNYNKSRDKWIDKKTPQGVAEGSEEINWIKPNFEYEWEEIEFQAKLPQVPADVRNYMAKHFPNKQAWMKSVQHGRPVVVSPNHGQKIRNYPDNKKDLLNALSPQSHDPQGPAKEKRVNALFDKGGPIEMPIILKTNKGLWLIGGKTRLGTANLLKGIPAKVWMIGGEQDVAEAWSEKYKRSINCDNPKGFSQRAHCQGRKKNNEQIELDERKKKRKTTKKKTNRYFYGPVYYGGYYGTGDSSGDSGGGE